MIILVPLNRIITDTTKWKQDGITIFHQPYFDEFDVSLSDIDIDDQTIYIAENIIHRVIALQLDRTNVLVVAGGYGDRTNQFGYPSGVSIDKKSDSIIICDGLNDRIVRWSRQNAINGEIINPKIDCSGVAMDDKGYLYVSDHLKKEVRRWDIRLKNQSIIVAGGNGPGVHSRQLLTPTFIFVDKDYSVYVVDELNHRVMKWMKDATEGIVVAGGNGDGDKLTQLYYPAGIIVDHLGNIYVADGRNDRVMRWINGAKEGTIVVGGNGRGNETNQLFDPSDLLFDKHGNLYVYDAANHRLQKFLIESN
jgi:sugar lactone lactonase YvrE